MKYITLTFFSLLIFTLCADDFPIDNDVMVLTDDTFDAALQKYENLMVLFYAPWCGHCKKFHPEYAKAAVTLKKENLILAKLDATVNKKMSEKYKIQGFPTTKLFIKGNPIEYNGGRTEKDVVSWMRKKTGPVTTKIESEADLEKFKNDNEVALVYFGSDAKDLEEFTKAARNDDEHVFATVEKNEIIERENVKPRTVLLFKKFDEGKNELKEEINENNINEFITKHASPRVMKFDDKAAQLIFGKNQPGLFLYVDSNSEKYKELYKLFNKLADQVVGKLKVVISGVKEGLESRLAEYIGVSEKDLPCVKIADTRVDLKKYNLEGEITEDNVLKFVKDWEEGKLKPHLKSEEIPKTNNEPVYKLVGKSFNKEVIESDKDVFVKFYAPWCGHCKALAPKYIELAKKLKGNDKILIAEIDSTANEVEEVQITGFPTLKFWPAGKKDKPFDYNGDRSLDDMLKFVKEHATNPIHVEEEKKEEKKDEKKTEKKDEKKDDKTKEDL